VDFTGQFEAHRLTALSNRLAPVQVFYPNYPATSGVPNVDYVLTDRWLCPPGYERNYSETVHRVPSGCIVYAPPGRVETRELPARSNGFVTFGLFQRAPKLNSLSWDAIAGVLRAMPDARLLIQHDAALRSKFTAELEARGVSDARLDFKGWLPIRERVQLMADADIALDTFPYNGQTTTCECLWMGVPVVTRSGETHVSRVAGSILHQVGLSDWIARSADEYVAIAARHANDLDHLANLRAGLRQRVAASPLVDAKGKAREFEQAYREMWRAWVQTATSSPDAATSPAPASPAPTLNAV
jgi:predicted O-linked N-acetylglucosamine transferase (SPINDLY family)